MPLDTRQYTDRGAYAGVRVSRKRLLVSVSTGGKPKDPQSDHGKVRRFRRHTTYCHPLLLALRVHVTNNRWLGSLLSTLAVMVRDA
jgi:hypothetical protein